MAHATRFVAVAVLIALVLCVPVQAHMWLNLTASRATGEIREGAVRNRDRVAGQMLRHEIAEAQRLAREWDAAHPQ
ncbi:MAG: hypothetical protein VX427_03315 [Acidobacteriota bacterium]|nr:hypothetical protein [Acidobacteriota bacterium]